MLHFENLSKLDTHLNYLSKKIKNQTCPAICGNLFLVGWCIRDLLLDIEENPTDIDLTLAGKPEEIYKNIDKSGLSCFITEKFGTMTLIKKSKVQSQKSKVNKKESMIWWLSTWWPDDEYKYEITPIRTEWGYDDCRHPEEITRSNDILLDSNRRDFTINCIYYTIQTIHELSQQKSQSKIKKDSKTSAPMPLCTSDSFLKLLDKHWFVFIRDLNLYILQDHNYIAKLFKEWIFQEDFLSYLENVAPDATCKIKDTFKASDNIRFVIDPHKGIQDLVNKKIQTVGTADKRFNEDALRIIRALRFPNILNIKLRDYYSKNSLKAKKFFDYNRETRQSAKRNAHLVENVAKERIKDEITKVFVNANPFWFIALLDEIHLLEYLFPALYETKHIEQPTRYHPFDIYTHSLLALYEIQKINPNYLVKLAVLYHDVGKVGQFDAYKADLSKEDIREILSGPLNHRKSWPELVKKDFSRLWFSNKEIDDISRYVSQHHRPEEFLGARPAPHKDAGDENKTKKLRKFLSEAGYERALNVLDICIADRMGQYNPLQSSNDVGDVYKAVGGLNILHESEGQFTMKNLAIKGDDLIKKFKLKPGPEIGKYLKLAFERAMHDISKKNNKKAIFEFLKWIVK